MERQVQEEEEDMLGTYCILSDTWSSEWWKYKILKWDLNQQEIHKNISSVVFQEDSICISSNVHLLEHQVTSDHSLVAFIHLAHVLCACSRK